MISSFRNEYYFLSNFYQAPITYGGIQYQNNEAAFQAQKVLCDETKKEFCNLSPNLAKRKGRKVQLRDDWEEVKFNIMHDIVKCKFSQNKDLRDKLLSTGDEYLEEGNNWGDRIWGTVNGKGKNHLGKILMDVREELKPDKNMVDIL